MQPWFKNNQFMKTIRSILLALTFMGLLVTAHAQESLVFSRDTIGELVLEGHYLNDRKEGTWVTWYPTGIVMRVEEYSNGMRDGLFLEIDSKGALTSMAFYRENLLEGISRQYGRAGKPIWEKNYKADKLHGRARIYYDGGILQEDSWYKNGLRDSVAVWYDTKTQKIAENHYREGRLEGPALTFYASGQVKSEKYYLSDNLNGPIKEFFEDGTVQMTGLYENGQKHGTWQYFDPQGKPVRSEKYVKGALK
jgi:antitoxin component YwqK of YwqJK toxin-antitoxin module